jgi:two-component system LytT family response regulator
MKALVMQLPEDQFVQINRSHLVNVERVKEVRTKPHGDFEVVLHNGTRLPGSRNHRLQLTRLLGAET